MIRSVFVLGLSLALPLPLLAADWPQFKGANAAGVAPDADLPTEWGKDKGIKWKTPLPARGVSSPVVVGGRVYLTCSSGVRDDRLHVLAFDDATGKQLWHRQLTATGGTACHPKTCMAAPTPAADATGVYALFATGDLAAFDADGTLRWYRSLTGDYPTITNQVGMAASPVLAGDRLIVPMDNAGEAFIAAVDVKTGKNVWKASRPSDISWVTPVVRPTAAGMEVLFAGPSGLVAYDAKTGDRRWVYRESRSSVPTATLAGDTLFYPGGGLNVLKLGDKGPEGAPIWSNPRLQTGYTSPLVYGGRVYAVDSEGFVSVSDAKTGKVLQRERTKGPYWASPVGGAGKVYFLNEKGVTTVFRADSDLLEQLAVNDLGEEGLGTPAIANGCLFIRTDKAIYCIGK